MEESYHILYRQHCIRKIAQTFGLHVKPSSGKTRLVYCIYSVYRCYLKLACVCCTTSLELAEVALKPVCLAREDTVCCVW